MFQNIPHRTRAVLVGVFILMAYSMLAYGITKNIFVGFTTDILSGLSVIGIALLMFPIFKTSGNKLINYAYITSKFVEGILMIIGGIIILNPLNENLRSLIYQNIHIYFFIAGALFFYILLYQSQVIPKYISIWGIASVIILFIITMIKLTGIKVAYIDVFLLPMILNEVFLAFWLIIKGFNYKEV